MIAIVASSIALGSGLDLTSCALDPEAQVALPDLLRDCVHHYAVNGTDVFWFAGDAATIVERMQVFAALAPLSVVLHSGTAEVRSPWDPEPRDIDADWQASLDFDCGRRGRHCRLIATRIDVWVDGNVDAAALTFPTTTEVSLAPQDLLRLLEP